MTPEQEHILAFVRGHRAVEALASLGISVTSDGDSIVVDNPHGWVAIAAPQDVAEGLLALASKTEDLRRWASLLLAATPFVDLALDDVPYGDALLEALWDATNGEPIRASALLAAQELRVP